MGRKRKNHLYLAGQSQQARRVCREREQLTEERKEAEMELDTIQEELQDLDEQLAEAKASLETRKRVLRRLQQTVSSSLKLDGLIVTAVFFRLQVEKVKKSNNKKTKTNNTTDKGKHNYFQQLPALFLLQSYRQKTHSIMCHRLKNWGRVMKS